MISDNRKEIDIIEKQEKNGFSGARNLDNVNAYRAVLINMSHDKKTYRRLVDLFCAISR